MALIERNREPSATELRWFGLMCVAFFGLMGALAYHRSGRLVVPSVLWIGSIGFAIVYYALPSIRRTSYRAWMTVTYPLGWTVSHLVLGGFFFLIFTPLGVAMRLFGRDPMQRRLDRARSSYWIEHRPTSGVARYWRQF